MTRWLLILQSVALAAILAWPIPMELRSRALGAPESDVAKHVWNLWWARAELRDGTAGMTTRLVNWPEGMRLYPIEPLNSALAILVPLQPVTLSNLIALLNLVLIGVCAGWLGRIVSGTERGALTTAALAQGCSFVAFTLHVGVGELREVWWLPLGLAVLLRATETLALRWFLALGLTLAAATISCFYHGLFLATAVAVYALSTLRSEQRLLVGYLVAAALAIGVTAPVVHTFSASYGAPSLAEDRGFLSWMTSGFAVDPHLGASLDTLDLIRPRADERAGADRLVYAYTGGRYVGVIALLLAAAGVAAGPRRARPWVLMAAATTVLAMGTRVLWSGAVVPIPIVLPMLWINRALAWFAEPLNFPVRFVSVTMIALATLGGLAVSRWRHAAWLVPLALIDIAYNDLVPWPRDTTSMPFGRAVVAPPGAVADLSAMLEGKGRKPSYATKEGALLPSWITTDIRNRGIAAQIRLNRPFQTVPIERQEMWALDGLLWTAALPLADSLVAEIGTLAGATASVQLLRDRGFGSVILTHACGAEPEAHAAFVLDERVGGRLDGGCFTLWTLAYTPTTPERLAVLRAEQASRVAAVPPPRLLSTPIGARP